MHACDGGQPAGEEAPQTHNFIRRSKGGKKPGLTRRLDHLPAARSVWTTSFSSVESLSTGRPGLANRERRENSRWAGLFTGCEGRCSVMAPG